MKITYIHHSAFLVETESAYLLFPGEAAGVFGGKTALCVCKPQASGPLFEGDL